MRSEPLRHLGIELLRLPSRLGPVPGWFPLAVEPIHRRLWPPDAGPVDVTIGGVRLRLDLNEYVQRRIFYRAFEVGELRFTREYLRPSDVMVDAGANVGLFTVVGAAAVGSTGQVHAFEPVPGNFARLEENVRLNALGQVVLNRAALGGAAGSLTLGVDHHEGATGGVSGHYTEAGRQDQVTVDVMRLDDYLANRVGRRVRLLKIDVEGMEPLVLGGMDRLAIDMWPDAIMVEINPAALAARGRSAEGILRILRDHGYRFSALGPRGGMRDARAGIERALRPHGGSRWSERVGFLLNLVAIR